MGRAQPLFLDWYCKQRGRPKKINSALKRKPEVERKKKAKKKLKLTNWGAPQNEEVLSDIVKSYNLKRDKGNIEIDHAVVYSIVKHHNKAVDFIRRNGPKVSRSVVLRRIREPLKKMGLVDQLN